MKTKVKKVLKWCAPHGLVEAGKKRTQDRELTAQRTAYHEQRRERIQLAQSAAEARNGSQLDPLDYPALISYLEGRGIPEVHLVEGSIPDKSLNYLREKIVDSFCGVGPLYGLHIGNFVGVSLAYFSGVLKSIHPQSLVVAIDPNLTHRTVANPQAHVAALLSACGLQENVLMIAGYSGKKSISNDGVVFPGYDPGRQYADEHGCENCIASLERIAGGFCHVALMDGNHEASYLRSEIERADATPQARGLRRAG